MTQVNQVIDKIILSTTYLIWVIDVISYHSWIDHDTKRVFKERGREGGQLRYEEDGGIRERIDWEIDSVGGFSEKRDGGSQPVNQEKRKWG